MGNDKTLTYGYYRVSTTRQETDGHAMERYREQLLKFGVPEDHIFYDVESGGSAARVGFNQVLERLRNGGDRIVVPCFDRFQRSTLIWETARQEFVKLGIEFVELDVGGGRPTDISSPTGILNTQLRAAYAQYQREVNRHHSIQGHKYRRSQNKPLKPMFPYTTNGDKLLLRREPYKDSGVSVVDIANEMIDAFISAGGLSPAIRLMCDRHGVKKQGKDWEDFPRDHSTFRRWLLSPTLRGHLVYFPEIPEKTIAVPNQHEPLIEPGSERDRLIRERVGLVKTGRKPAKVLNPLAGLCFCANCGTRMGVKRCGGGKRQQTTHNYLVCFGAYPVAGHERICDRRSSYGLHIEDAVLAVIEKLCDRAADIARFGAAPNERLSDTPEITALRQQIESLKSMGDGDLGEAIAIKETRLEQLVSRQVEAQKQDVKLLSILSELATIPDFWNEIPAEEKQRIFQLFVERVECDRGRVNVRLRI